VKNKKGGMIGEFPQAQLQKALYLLNNLTLGENTEEPVTLKHFLSMKKIRRYTTRETG